MPENGLLFMSDLKYAHELKIQVMYLVQAVKLLKINRNGLERLTIDLQRLLGKQKPSQFIE